MWLENDAYIEMGLTMELCWKGISEGFFDMLHVQKIETFWCFLVDRISIWFYTIDKFRAYFVLFSSKALHKVNAAAFLKEVEETSPLRDGTQKSDTFNVPSNDSQTVGLIFDRQVCRSFFFVRLRWRAGEYANKMQ